MEIKYKKTEITDHFYKNCFIDAKDSVNEWRVGQVYKINEQEKTIVIRYDGWPSRWDDVINLT